MAPEWSTPNITYRGAHAASLRWRKRGDFLLARGGGAVTDAHLPGELGEVLEGTIPGRRSDDEITPYKSLDIAVEDLASGRYAYRKDLASGRRIVLYH